MKFNHELARMMQEQMKGCEVVDVRCWQFRDCMVGIKLKDGSVAWLEVDSYHVDHFPPDKNKALHREQTEGHTEQSASSEPTTEK